MRQGRGLTGRDECDEDRGGGGAQSDHVDLRVPLNLCRQLAISLEWGIGFTLPLVPNVGAKDAHFSSRRSSDDHELVPQGVVAGQILSSTSVLVIPLTGEPGSVAETQDRTAAVITSRQAMSPRR